MAKVFDKIEDKQRKFIAAQYMFFVASAPLTEDGHINISPKGQMDTFRILDDNTVAYLDFGGSGIETQAHLQENGRITVMFCAFDGPPNILRLFGTGEAIDFDHSDFGDLMTLFPNYERARAVIKVRIKRVQDSCGYGVPYMDFKGERDAMEKSLMSRPEEQWKDKRRTSNAVSIDGLPGLKGVDS